MSLDTPTIRVLVAYASRHGATQGIAEQIARTLEESGLEVTLRQADEVQAVEGYDAFVIGSAAYMFHWLKEASGFVRRHRAHLAEHPVWLFSSGPVGTQTVDEKGRDVVEMSTPREFAEFAELIHPRGQQVFWGAYDPIAPPVGLAERLVSRMPAARSALPAGDFRDWQAIAAWAQGIADELLRQPVACD